MDKMLMKTRNVKVVNKIGSSDNRIDAPLSKYIAFARLSCSQFVIETLMSALKRTDVYTKKG